MAPEPAIAGVATSLRRGVLSLSVLLPLFTQIAIAAYLAVPTATRSREDAFAVAAAVLAATAALVLGWRDGRRPEPVFGRGAGCAVAFAFGALPVAAVVLYLLLGRERWLLPAVATAAYAVYALALAASARGWRRSWLVVPALALAVLGALLAWKWLGTDGEALHEEVDLRPYQPFAPGNRLVRATGDGAPPFTPQDAPRLDGATAAYPLYAAMAQAFYTPEAARGAVAVSRTGAAYERLIRGEVDAIFVAQASPAHERMAREQGVELRLTPVAREAFVFMVSPSNRVRGLSAQQVRAIYAGRIHRWEEVGGWPEAIIPYQRPANSGSQTVMEARVMQGEAMRQPLQDQVVHMMGPTVRRVAGYRNARQSLGYSFRYYVTGMHGDSGVRLLAIDGVQPTRENVRSGAYPYGVDVYMVTTQRSRAGTQRLRDWLLAPAGQKLVEEVGYLAR